MNRQQKQKLVDQLHKSFSESQASFLVQYQGLSVAQMLQLRRGIRQTGGFLKVAKMRLVKRSLDGVECAQMLEPYCKGQLGVVFAVQEPPAVAKVLHDFAKEHNSLKLVAGCLDSQLLDKQAVIRIASLPSKEVLMAQLVGTMKLPITGLASVLRVLIQRLLIVLKEVEKKK